MGCYKPPLSQLHVVSFVVGSIAGTQYIFSRGEAFLNNSFPPEADQPPDEKSGFFFRL